MKSNLIEVEIEDKQINRFPRLYRSIEEHYIILCTSITEGILVKRETNCKAHENIGDTISNINLVRDHEYWEELAPGSKIELIQE